MQIVSNSRKMVDAIIYIENFMALVGHVQQNHPELLNYENGIPVIRGFARTPAVQNGNKVMVYARFYEDQVNAWDNMPYVEVLARKDYVNRFTVDEVYEEVFNDPEKLEKYDSVYDRSPKEYFDEELNENVSYSPPDRFGSISS